MYRLTHTQLTTLLETYGYEHLLEDLNKISAQTIDVIEINFEFIEKGTEDEVIHISELNIFTKLNTVIFAKHYGSVDDMMLDWAPTKPQETYKELP